jgi:hypothetical protein
MYNVRMFTTDATGEDVLLASANSFGSNSFVISYHLQQSHPEKLGIIPPLSPLTLSKRGQGDTITVAGAMGRLMTTTGILTSITRMNYYRSITSGLSTAQEIEVMLDWNMPPGMYQVRMYNGAEELLGVSNSFVVTPPSSPGSPSSTAGGGGGGNAAGSAGTSGTGTVSISLQVGNASMNVG